MLDIINTLARLIVDGIVGVGTTYVLFKRYKIDETHSENKATRDSVNELKNVSQQNDQTTKNGILEVTEKIDDVYKAILDIELNKNAEHRAIWKVIDRLRDKK